MVPLVDYPIPAPLRKPDCKRLAVENSVKPNAFADGTIYSRGLPIDFFSSLFSAKGGKKTMKTKKQKQKN